MENDRKCLYCDKKIVGRKGKKYCNDYCRSAYQYKTNKGQANPLFAKVDRQLKLNRKILSKYNQAGKVTVRKELLEVEGFDPNYFTHYWKNQRKQVYLFCYEFGFMSANENGKEKYLLIQWQDYMNK